MITWPTLHRVSQQSFQGHVVQRTYVDIARLTPCQSGEMRDFLPLTSLPKNQNGNPLGLMTQDG